ncbi:cupin [Mycobacterium sp. MS1601]|uniref:cupin domain-containing protein n=1 Tax=Mycobacterium sp. MS1601 TaxID=1936029 RepID=UPI0009796900|nr:cupin domain-containing protein [Mycobacterium sp. MS1601]AQA01801.1 cupin [Mycobacterium sp. MS1601]
MQPNTVVRAISTALTHEPVPVDQSVSGSPSTATRELGEFAGSQFGIWEMSVGVMTDVEADELFVVLSGSATIEFADGSPTLSVGAGDVVRLAAGSETTWTVSETLRKVYLV